MAQQLEKSKDKIQVICDKLRHEVLEPANCEAENIIADAKKAAADIIKNAKADAQQIISQAKAQIEQERNVFRSSLEQAAKQVVENLRQKIEQSFFDHGLERVIAEEGSQPNVVVDLIAAVVDCLQKEGIDSNFEVIIPTNCSKEDVTRLLIAKGVNNIKANQLSNGTISAGIKVKLIGKKMTLDITDQTLKEMLSAYARSDFRKTIFSS